MGFFSLSLAYLLREGIILVLTNFVHEVGEIALVLVHGGFLEEPSRVDVLVVRL